MRLACPHPFSPTGMCWPINTPHWLTFQDSLVYSSRRYCPGTFTGITSVAFIPIYMTRRQLQVGIPTSNVLTSPIIYYFLHTWSYAERKNKHPDSMTSVPTHLTPKHVPQRQEYVLFRTEQHLAFLAAGVGNLNSQPALLWLNYGKRSKENKLLWLIWRTLVKFTDLFCFTVPLELNEK